jgi:hypothetical protein
VIGGIGLGLGYVSPVSTLIRWFPDHRGMATGLAIMGFGGGAIIGAPLKTWLLSHFSRAPEFLGSTDALQLVTEQGRQFAVTAAGRIEVVVATAAQAAALPGGGEAGAYAVGTGSTGAAATFLVLAALYVVVMGIAAFSYRVPATGWLPAGWTPPAETASHGMISTHNVHADEAIRTPQFWLLWVVLCFNVTAGIGVLGVAKTMMGEIFGSAMPALVTAGFASAFVLMISVFNMAGRFAWASASDAMGRKNTYHCFFVLWTCRARATTARSTSCIRKCHLAHRASVTRQSDQWDQEVCDMRVPSIQLHFPLKLAGLMPVDKGPKDRMADLCVLVFPCVTGPPHIVGGVPRFPKFIILGIHYLDTHKIDWSIPRGAPPSAEEILPPRRTAYHAEPMLPHDLAIHLPSFIQRDHCRAMTLDVSHARPAQCLREPEPPGWHDGLDI